MKKKEESENLDEKDSRTKSSFILKTYVKSFY